MKLQEALLNSKWGWLMLILALAFIMYHAPRLAASMPI
jgi:hypothetical protein